ncbi:hypothetical protein SNOUR_16430 [Streptomyces noursei ATCC 11455]|nr:hypothetical protein SNOUR_16430 [Streptomyces noursei ATCC 11455]
MTGEASVGLAAPGVWRSSGRTDIESIFPFGYGPLYTASVHSDLAVQRADNGPTAVVTVRNTGDRAGEGTVHAYLGVSTDATMPQVKK